MNIEIRNNVPVPKRINHLPRGRQKTPIRLAIESLQIGQSFEIKHLIKREGGLRTMCLQVSTATDHKFTVRRLREGDKKGTAVYGVWRIA